MAWERGWTITPSILPGHNDPSLIVDNNTTYILHAVYLYALLFQGVRDFSRSWIFAENARTTYKVCMYTTFNHAAVATDIIFKFLKFLKRLAIDVDEIFKKSTNVLTPWLIINLKLVFADK